MLTERKSWKERAELGKKMSDQLGGGNPLVFVGNVPHALPPAAREELARHTVNPGVYEGRTPWIAASYNLSEAPIVVMQERPFIEEMNVLSEACSTLNLNTPRVHIHESGFAYDRDQIQGVIDPKAEYFHHPFVGASDYSNGSNGPALPDSSPFQNKARMREHLHPANTVPGIPILADGCTIREHCANVRKAIKALDGDVRAKVATTASGMSTIQVNSYDFNNVSASRFSALQELVPQYLHKPDQIAQEDIIVEQEIKFGKGDGYADFGFRGYVLPSGDFNFTSVGRVVSTPEGVYQGMFMAAPENSEMIGLSNHGLEEGAQIMKGFAQSIHSQGYFGPVNLDVFENCDKEHPGLVHDFNMRDGGSSASGAFLNAVNPKGVVLDIDLRLTSSELSDFEINNMIQVLWKEHKVIAYSTTFLRHPETQSDGTKIYTVKVMAPIESSIETDDQGREVIQSTVDRLNEWELVNGQFHFDK